MYLPPATLAAYQEHLNSRTQLLVQQMDDGILIRTNEAELDDSDEVLRFVPSGAAFFMTCESDVEATFASGSELVDLHFTDNINPFGHPPSPELTVPYNSVAASTLFATLCDEARRYLLGHGFVEHDMSDVIGQSVDHEY